LDAYPNLVLKLNSFEEQLKSIRAVMDHMQTNLLQIWAHGNMAAMKPSIKKAKAGCVAEIY
jgi:hypothetical protein